MMVIMNTFEHRIYVCTFDNCFAILKDWKKYNIWTQILFANLKEFGWDIEIWSIYIDINDFISHVNAYKNSFDCQFKKH